MLDLDGFKLLNDTHGHPAGDAALRQEGTLLAEQTRAADMVSRYGDFVRFRPPVKPVTWLLWFGPFLLLIGAVVMLVRLVRRNQRSDGPPALDPAQRAKAQSLLKDLELPS